MKNAFKLLGIIALAVIIGFSMTACSHGDDIGGGDTNSGEDPSGNNGEDPSGNNGEDSSGNNGEDPSGNNGEDPSGNNGEDPSGDDGEDPIDGEDLVYGPGDAPEGLFAQWYSSQVAADAGNANWLYEFKSDGTVIIFGEEYLFKVVGDEDLYVITAEELRSNPEGGVRHTFTLDGTELSISCDTTSLFPALGTFYKETE
jgi:hypothetical protein